MFTQYLIMIRVLVLVLLTLSSPPSASSTSASDISYVYDTLGRLVGVSDQMSDTAIYQYDAVGNLLGVSKQSSAVVSIIAFAPTNGPIGTTVAISGTGFSPVVAENTVKFNGVIASVISASATQLITIVPSGATTGPIVVTTTGGSATSSTNFTVGSGTAPTISGFTPTIGTPSTTVTITGTNFSTTAGNNKVKFNVKSATVNSATATSLATTVSTGATSGHLTVTTPSGKATSSGDFFVPPSPYTTTDVQVTDRMILNSSKMVGITMANKIGLILFEATAGQRMSLEATNVTFSSASIQLYAPSGTASGAAFVTNTGGGLVDAVTLAETGTYTVRVAPASGSTGSLTLVGHELQDVTSTIIPGGPAVTVTTTTPGQNAGLTFSGTEGQRVSLSMTGSTIGYNINVALKRPDGTTLASTAFGGTTGFMDTQTLPVSGTYTILLDPTSTNTGTATFTLYDLPADVTATIIPNGPAVTMTTTTPGQNASLTFSGTVGQRVSLSMTGSTIGYNINVAFKRPDGTTLASTAFGGTTGFMDTQSLPASGIYTIVLDPTGTNIGTATFTLADVQADVTATIIPGGPAVTVTTTTPGQNASLTFSGTAGQRVSLSMTGSTIGYNIGVWLKQPDGTTLASSTFGGATGFLDTQTLPVSGTYTILLDPTSTNTGTATFTVYDLPPDVTGTMTPGGPAVTVTTTTPGQNASLTFSGTAGQQVTTRATNSTMGCVSVTLLKPDNAALTSLFSCSNNFNLTTQTLPATGTYMLRIDPSGTNTGSIDMTVTGP